MGTLQIIGFTIAVAVVAAIIAFLCVFVPNTIKRRTPKRYHYDEPASFDYKKSAHANGVEDGSSVDHQKAMTDFKNG